jgi:C-terminal processing protease CtpA/Prc
MKPGTARSLLFRTFLLLAAGGLALAPVRGQEPVPAVPAAVPVTPQQKTALEALDRAIARFDALLARDDDARHQMAERTVLDGFKKRRDALRTAFDQSKYDDLRTELNLEYQRLAAWVGPRPATS